MQELTKQAFGAAGFSQAVGTNLAVISTPGAFVGNMLGIGTYKVWGTVRHTLADGVRLVLGGTTVLVISNAPNQATNFGPLVLNITNRIDDIFLELEVATGAADTASGNLYIQKLER